MSKITDKSDALKENLLEALTKTLGIVSTACEKVGIARSTFYVWYDEDSKFKADVDANKERTIDFAESQLLQNVSNGKEASIFFYLKTQAKHRNYIERVDHTGNIQHGHVLQVPSNNRDNDENEKP